MSNPIDDKRLWLDQASLWVRRIDVDVAAFTRYWESVRLPEDRAKTDYRSRAGLHLGTVRAAETLDHSVPLCGIPLHQVVAANGAIVDAAPVSEPL